MKIAYCTSLKAIVKYKKTKTFLFKNNKKSNIWRVNGNYVNKYFKNNGLAHIL